MRALNRARKAERLALVLCGALAITMLMGGSTQAYRKSDLPTSKKCPLLSEYNGTEHLGTGIGNVYVTGKVLQREENETHTERFAVYEVATTKHAKGAVICRGLVWILWNNSPRIIKKIPMHFNKKGRLVVRFSTIGLVHRFQGFIALVASRKRSVHARKAASTQVPSS